MSLLTNKGKNSLETRKALKNMFDTSYNQICSLENAGINPHSYYSLEVGPLASRIYKPRTNRNGIVVKLPVPISKKYTKFSLPLNIADKNDLKELRSRKNKNIQTLAERSFMDRTSLEVFVDNVKVPDLDVFITVMDGTTDVYIPANYFEIDGSRLDIIRRHYSKDEPYINCTIRKTNQLPAFITLCGCSSIEGNNENELHSCDSASIIKSEDDFRIYKNGKLLQRDQYQITPIFGDFKLISIALRKEITVLDTLEICVETGTNWKEEKLSIDNPYIFFPNNLLPMILPISPGICDIYVEGRRLFSNDIEIVSPRVFKIKDTIYRVNSRLSVFMNYNGNKLNEILGEGFDFKEDTSRYLYCLTDIQKENLFMRDIYPDTKEDWVVPKEDEIRFPCKKIIDESKFRTKESYEEYLDTSIKSYIKENAHNIIPLMAQYSAIDDDVLDPIDWEYIEEFTRMDTTKDIGSITYENGSEFTTFDGVSFSEPMVLLEYRRQYDTTEDVIIEIDNVKVEKSNIFLYDRNDIQRLYINKKVFDIEKESFNLTIKHLPIYNKTKNILKLVNTNEETTFRTSLDLDSLGDIQTLDDILVFSKEEDGYKICKNPFKIEDGSIVLEVNGSKQGKEYLVSNSSFYEYRKVIIETEEQQFSILLDDTNGYPNCSLYGLMIYCDGELLAENIDYFLTSQFTHRELTNGRIIFKNRPSIGSVFELYFFEQPRITCSSCKILDSEYDVVYIRNLKAGFSTKYMDLYINNVKIPDDRIVEIALNMVLIKDLPEGMIERPYYNAFVRSKLKRHLFSIQEYINYYLDNQSKWKLYLDRLIETDSQEVLDVIIKSFVTDETPHDKSLNVDSLDVYSPIIDEVGRHLMIGRIPRRIDANRVTEFLYEKHYIQLMSEDDWENPTIELNANRHNILDNYRIHAEEPSTGFKTEKEITEIFAKTLMDGDQYISDSDNSLYPNTNMWNANSRMKEEINWYDKKLRELEEFDNGVNFYDYKMNPISRELYLEEMSFVDTSLFLDANYSIDANPNPDEKVEFTESLFTVNLKFNKLRKTMNRDRVNYPDLDLIYTYDMKSFCATEVESVIINGKERQFTYSKNENKIYFMTKLECDDTIEVIYKRKVFND